MTRKGGGRDSDGFFLGAHPVGEGYAGYPEGGGRESGGRDEQESRVASVKPADVLQTEKGHAPAAANPAVESLADFIIPKAAVNPAARTLSVKGSSKPFVCQECMTEEPGGPAGHHCYEVCQRNKRIRELEVDLAEMRLEAESHGLEIVRRGHAWAFRNRRAEKAEARVKDLERVYAENTDIKKLENAETRVDELEARIEYLYAEANAREISVSNLKARVKEMEEEISECVASAIELDILTVHDVKKWAPTNTKRDCGCDGDGCGCCQEDEG